jgi:acetolactate synthase regulatory subunit
VPERRLKGVGLRRVARVVRHKGVATAGRNGAARRNAIRVRG